MNIHIRTSGGSPYALKQPPIFTIDQRKKKKIDHMCYQSMTVSQKNAYKVVIELTMIQARSSGVVELASSSRYTERAIAKDAIDIHKIYFTPLNKFFVWFVSR